MEEFHGSNPFSLKPPVTPDKKDPMARPKASKIKYILRKKKKKIRFDKKFIVT